MGVTMTWRQPPEREPRSHHEEVVIDRGRARTGGYLSHSDRSGPGVLVLHEFFGLQPSFRWFCDFLTEQGFTAFAPDLYEGRLVSSVDAAEAMASSLDRAAARAKLTAAAEHLRDNWHPRVGVVGFSLGGWLAVDLATVFPLDAVVLYYGLGPLERVDPAMPVLGHFCEHDEWEPSEEVLTAFARSDTWELEIYPGVGHWFANPSVPDGFVEEAAARAHARTVDFLTHHLS